MNKKINYLQFPAKKVALSVSGRMNILTGQTFHPVGTTLVIWLEFSQDTGLFFLLFFSL